MYFSTDAAVMAPQERRERRVALEALRGVFVGNEELLELVFRIRLRVLRERVTRSQSAPEPNRTEHS